MLDIPFGAEDADFLQAVNSFSDIEPDTLEFRTFSPNVTKHKDIFQQHRRRAWDKSQAARTDLQHHLRLTRRASVNFVSIYQKSLHGRTLAEIKSDQEMVRHFASEIVPVIQETIGYFLHSGQWCICTTPKRRHTTQNFATLVSIQIANHLRIPFYEDVAFCRTKQRINAIFNLGTLPKEPNIIVYDDFVTTGSTLLAMKNLLLSHSKNLAFFASVNNSL